MASTNPLPAFSPWQAFAWTAITTLLLSFAVNLLAYLAPAAASSLLVGGAIETLIYGGAALALLGARRQPSERLRLLGFAPAPVWTLLAGAVLGVALHGPADFLAWAIDRFFPRSDAELLETARRLAPSDPLARAGVFALAALIVPLVEEVFFRGAMFARLRLPASRASALVVSGLLFVICHLEPKLWPPLAIVAFSLTLLRALGRGIWPCFLLHGTFNATTLLVAFSQNPEAPFSRDVSVVFALAGTVISAAVAGLVFRHIDLDRREFV